MDISIQYLLLKEHIGQIYREMKGLYEDVYISELRDALAKACNEFPIAHVWENYDGIVKKMKNRCDQILKKRHAVCWGLQLWGVRLEKRYEKKLVLTQVKKQAQNTETAKKMNVVVRANTQVVLANYSKDVTVIKS